MMMSKFHLHAAVLELLQGCLGGAAARVEFKDFARHGRCPTPRQTTVKSFGVIANQA